MNDEPVSLPDSVAIKEAVKRAELWMSWGCPESSPHMPQHEYDRDYRGRIWCASEAVLKQMQQVLKIILCPNCYEEGPRGISVTRFYTRVEDDVMTVFPAVGHFLCHHCGFEEYAPLKYDPRNVLGQQGHQVKMPQMMAQRHEALRQGYDTQYGGPLNQGVGISSALGSEDEALRRIYELELHRLGQAMVNPPVKYPLLSKVAIDKKP